MPAVSRYLVPTRPGVTDAAAGFPRWALIVLAGHWVWVGVYLGVLIIGGAYRTYAMPMVAICLNCAWEWRFVVDRPKLYPDPMDTPHPLFFRTMQLWLVLDLFILLQLLVFGRSEQSIPILRDSPWLFASAVFTIVLGSYRLHSVLHHGFRQYLGDRPGALAAYFNNLVMSTLFIPMFFSRTDLRPVIWIIGIGKLVGTGLVSLGAVLKERSDQKMPLLAPAPNEAREVMDWLRQIFLFLYRSVFLLDLLYVLLFALVFA